MRLSLWVPAVAVAALVMVASPARAQACGGSAFRTCGTIAPVATMSIADIEALGQDVGDPASANGGCPTPNGTQGAVSVASNDPHCAGGSGDVASVVPEPGSLVLFGSALFGLGAVLLKRRRPRS